MKIKIFKYKYEIIIFTVEAICMSLELVASRVLAPYFGTSNLVWTSVIGIILLSSSLGNYLGGKLADENENENEKKLKYILLFASIFIIIIPLIEQNILNILSSIINDIRVGAIISTIVLFFVPSLILGTIIPIILKIKLKKIEDTGKTAGKIYAISTVGGIFGTFLSGFILVPNFGSVQILFVLSIILLLISLFTYMKFNNKATFFCIIILMIIDIVLFSSFNYLNILNENYVLENKKNVKLSLDTQYGRVWIYNIYYRNEPIRMLEIDNGYESATFTNKDKIYELVFDYTKFYDLMFNSKNNIDNVLLIGGAGYSYPKYYISHYNDKKIDVVEIDGEITNVAKKYFYLDNLIEEYNLNENKRLNLITDDGRTYLNSNQKKYDAILNDAFSGNSPVKTLTTLECINLIKNSLVDNGIYLSNVISAIDGEKSAFLKAEVNTLKLVFKNVYVIPCKSSILKEKKQNLMVIATDQDMELENICDINILENEIILTDNYCPVEIMTQN